jgi:hypothetical protein
VNGAIADSLESVCAFGNLSGFDLPGGCTETECERQNRRQHPFHDVPNYTKQKGEPALPPAARRRGGLLSTREIPGASGSQGTVVLRYRVPPTTTPTDKLAPRQRSEQRRTPSARQVSRRTEAPSRRPTIADPSHTSYRRAAACSGKKFSITQTSELPV